MKTNTKAFEERLLESSTRSRCLSHSFSLWWERARWTKTGTKITFFPFGWQIYAQNWNLVLQCSFYGFNSIYIKWIEIENNADSARAFVAHFLASCWLLHCLFVWVDFVGFYEMALVHWWYGCGRWWCALVRSTQIATEREWKRFAWIKDKNQLNKMHDTKRTEPNQTKRMNAKREKERKIKTKEIISNTEDSTKTPKSNERRARWQRYHTENQRNS